MEIGLISIILPVYNAEKHLRETIESVMNQTYSKFEIIAVNDGSQDSSLEILKQFSDERIRIVDKENTGVSDSRNIAIDLSNGEFVCFLDADDYFSPYYLQRMHETALANHADMVVCNYMPFRGVPIFEERKTEAVPIKKIDTLVQAGVLTSTWTKLVKTSILRKYGIRFDRSMTFGEDLFFCWKAYLASESVWMLDEKLYGYRMTGSGATSKFHPALYEKYKDAFTDLKTFGKETNKNNEHEMDVFFTTRIPSFLLMTVRGEGTLLQKRKRLLQILNDNTIQSVFEEWDLFISEIDPTQIEFYSKCKNGKVHLLLLDGYKRNIVMWLKNKVKGLL